MEAACSSTMVKETYGVIPQMEPAMKALEPTRKKPHCHDDKKDNYTKLINRFKKSYVNELE
jgi:hypothetical protein